MGGLQFQPHSAESNGVNTPSNSNGSNSGEGPEIKRESGLSGQLPMPLPRGLPHASSTGQVHAPKAGQAFRSIKLSGVHSVTVLASTWAIQSSLRSYESSAVVLLFLIWRWSPPGVNQAAVAVVPVPVRCTLRQPH